MLILIIGLIIFPVLHLMPTFAPRQHDALVARFGANRWRGIFSVISLIGLALVVYGYSISPFIDVWYPPKGMTHLTLTLMLFAVICLVASLMPAGHIATKTKHPMVLSVKIWALAHLLSNGDLRSILLFGTFLAWGVITRISLKRRERAGLLTRAPFVSAKYDLYAVVIGLVAYVAIVLKLHELLIGVSPLPM
ncbi:NnrU family protein [Allorhizobium taibaishanense]|uniref:NnrU family protein n=1 Tax=Allorhizobium taibaishanense TaxID=887144 RepID=A0A1Q9A449_9HYPH|nr:NnrU family protein [Allorhizobium taibaishanense]MBB4006420.1 putative membrane protein [Allorhizobium taibaishanense]OLP49365.1 NnrU family protein [Allorhizobium taibaishanense]